MGVCGCLRDVLMLVFAILIIIDFFCKIFFEKPFNIVMYFNIQSFQDR